MKKLTLTVAILLSGTYLFAQNNNSEIEQQNSHNVANVDQVGSNHQSEVLQISNAGSAGQQNSAEVKQRNRNGYDNNSSNIIHRGNSHSSTVDQAGQNNIQVYIGGRVGGSFVVSNVNNETYAIQRGDGNDGKQSIYGSSATGSYLRLSQLGSDNTSEQLAAWAVTSEGYVNQAGNNNTAWQQIDGTDEYASINQLGNRNTAGQWIENGSSADNESYISQTGNDNVAYASTSGQDNFFRVTQVGNSNTLNGLNDQWATQDGDRNQARLVQTGNNNTFSVGQDGQDNVIEGVGLLAGLGGAQLGNYNSATISQDGSNNLSQSLQRGNNNSIDLEQDGSGHESSVYQHRGLFLGGNNNIAEIVQTGASQISVIDQNGHNNVATVNQGN